MVNVRDPLKMYICGRMADVFNVNFGKIMLICFKLGVTRSGNYGMSECFHYQSMRLLMWKIMFKNTFR